MSNARPAFPSPAPAPILISDSGRGDSDSEISPKTDSSVTLRQHQYATVNVISNGPQNDEELEILSVHEQMVDDAIARSPPDTARAASQLPDDEDHENPEDPERPITSGSSAFLKTEHGQVLQERLTALVAAFRARSLQAKQLVMQPPPPEPAAAAGSAGPPPPPPPKPEDSGPKPAEPPKKEPEKKKPPPTPPKKAPPEPPPPVTIKLGGFSVKVPEWFYKIPRPQSFDPHSKLYLSWLVLVSICFVYNAIVIPYRAAFPVQTPEWLTYWFIADYFCDAIFLIDLIIWKPSIRAFSNGIEVNDKKEIMRSYVASDDFALDICCLIPLDLFYLIPEVNYNPLLRCLRLIKIHSYWEFLDRVDLLLPNPYYFRVLRSVANMIYLIHSNACVFYYFSYIYDFDANNQFVYNNENEICRNASKSHPPAKCNFPGEYSAYIFCFFFSVSMVTIIGNLNFPQLVPEMVYSTILWFIGVFVFATLVGQIRDVLKAMTRQEDEFYEVMDAIVEHMHTLKIPKELQDRVRTWLLFNWEQQKTIDEGRLLDGLPVKLRTDLAMEVHFSTIHKVQLFKDVDKKVLEELLLRLKPSVYLPNDYICKKGEIGKEMYIIKSGVLEVVLPDGRVAVTLSPGSVFGEISLLALAGGNRRTADVRSKGFSNLYVLSKADLNDVMKDYPETFEALKNKAHELMNKGKPPPEKPPTPPPVEIIPTRPPTPEMVRVALSILKPTSLIRRRLSQSAMELTVFRQHKPGDSDHEEMEIEMRTDHDVSTDNRGPTPEPVHDIPYEIINAPINEIVTAETHYEKHPDSSSAKQSVRRRRAASIAGESSSDSEEINQATTQSRLRRKKPHRGSSNNQSRSQSTEQSILTLKTGTSPPPLVPPENTSIAPKFPLTQSSETLELMGHTSNSSAPHVHKSSSLASLKRRLFNAPKIFPLATGHDVGSELDSSAGNSTHDRIRVFDFGPVPQEVVGSEVQPSISFSDYEYANLSDSFTGVTFSGPDSP